MKIIKIKDDWFDVCYVKALHSMSDSESTEYKHKFNYDVVFKNDTAYYFCNKITIANFEEITTPETENININKV